MADLLDDLNEPQRAAVSHGEGPLLVLAGAGSGKTRVLTYRVAHLIERRAAAPHEITAVTFTNKAAREMAERVERLVGGRLDGGFVGTFHRWALELLRRHPEAAGLPRHFAIIDADEQRALVGKVLKELGLDATEHPPRAVLARISGEVNRCQDPATLGARSGDEVTPRVFERYRALKATAGVVDFDDMLHRALALLRAQPQVLEAARWRGRWLLVDEFQDTNRLQMELLAAVVTPAGNITAVGDEDQSIYGWRGAELENILSFERHFPGARVVALEENYRSSRPILDAAGSLIAHNAARRGKRLFTRRPGGDPVRLYVGDDERAEARWVADRIEELARSRPLGEMAVLVRTNAQTRPFEEELTRRRVAHRVVGGLRFWHRKEVRDALAYLRLLVRPDDVVAFERVVNVPARGIGSATLDVLERHAAATGLPLPAAARQLPDALTRRARIALEGFYKVLDNAAGQRELLDPGDFVGWLLEASGLLALVDGDDEERVARRENLQQLAAAVAEAAVRGQDLPDFLDAVALLEEGDEEAGAEAVSLMTLHAAKGLEFDVVVLAALEDGLLPHANSHDDPGRLEEERRLAYVGMTRARHWLALTAARARFLFGSRAPSRPSRFLLELPTAAVLDVSDAPLTIAAAERRVRNDELAAPVGVARPLRPGRPAAATATDAAGQGWRPGNRVRHSSFGTGVVLSCQGRGDNLKLVVYFDRAGRKTLVPTIAKLEKV
jgi:DNA helicase-2/ATP-dependent DNA helicase PcrA